MNPTEQQIRQQLGVPDAAKRVMIFAQSAHMDWDWLNTFPYNVDKSTSGTPGGPCDGSYFPANTSQNPQPADNILQQVYNLLTSFGDYWWSICEIGFLQAFAENSSYSQYFQQMVAGGRLSVVGGGITSPDNLLPAGEGFLRDFLIAKKWFSQQGLTWSGQVWLPDDFGHDSQLPVMLQALGAQGVGFARIPGACDQGNVVGDAAKTLLGKAQEQPGGLDFWWQAADGSRVFAHWLPNHYAQGDGIAISDNEYTSDADLAQCNGNETSLTTPSAHIQGYMELNGPVSPTPYILVDFGSDFNLPIGGTYPGTAPSPQQQLMYYAQQWNQGSGPQSYAGTGMWVVVATFDHYSRLVQANVAGGGSQLLTRTFHGVGLGSPYPFRSNPYWMGFYASRPELKILHDRAVRALVAAEVYGLLDGGSVDPRIDTGWNQLAPSTHHDYVTGTSLTCVYDNEQTPLLEQAVASGQAARDAAVHAVATAVGGGQAAAVAFNQLGFQRRALAELPASGEPSPVPPGAQAVQASSDGGWVGLLEAPSFGYQATPMTTPPSWTVSAPQRDGQGNVLLDNGTLQALISGADGTVAKMVDQATGKTVFAGAANVLTFFSDPSGDVYRFGYEMNAFNTFAPVAVTAQVDASGLEILESGPIRARVRATVNVATQSGTQPAFQESYVVTYDLVAGDRYLRVTVTGKAPEKTAVMATFPFSDTPSGMLHGTPYHWDHKDAATFDSRSSGFHPVFEAAHDFVVPVSGSQPLAAVYPRSIRAWTVSGASLYGCILRNSMTVTWVNSREQSDAGSHTIEYALRAPGGLPTPESGNLLRDARNYNTPLAALSVAGSGSRPTTSSLVSVVSPASAVLTVAKTGTFDPGSVILRLYQASNQSQQVTLDLSAWVSSRPGGWVVIPFTALEAPVDGAPQYDVVNGRVTVPMPNAVLTLKLTQLR